MNYFGWRRTLAFVLALTGVIVSVSARGETFHPFDVPMDATPDLSFPSEPVPFKKEVGTLLFKPEGAGPFPAVVLMPTCGGHNYSYHVFDWAEKALKRGYVVLVVDPLRPRGVYQHNCLPPLKVLMSRVLKDSFDAAAHLRTLPFVHKEKIALMGYSQGAMIGLGASGPEHFGRDGRRPFQAIVSFYPGCVFPNIRRGNKTVDVRYLARDVKAPLLVLMGDEDTETEPENCVPLLSEQKGQGAPVEWEVYKNATHVFDDVQWSSREFRKKDFRGVDVVYRYNPEATKAAEERAFAFIERHMKRP